MIPDQIYYQSIKQYKYELLVEYSTTIKIRPTANIVHKYFSLTKDGLLLIRAGYKWDGPSGPAIDTKSLMRGSNIHDVLYQCMRLGFLNCKKHRKLADEELRRIYLEDAIIVIQRKKRWLNRVLLNKIRKWLAKVRGWQIYYAVRLFAGRCAKKTAKSEIPVLTAP